MAWARLGPDPCAHVDGACAGGPSLPLGCPSHPPRSGPPRVHTCGAVAVGKWARTTTAFTYLAFPLPICAGDGRPCSSGQGQRPARWEYWRPRASAHAPRCACRPAPAYQTGSWLLSQASPATLVAVPALVPKETPRPAGLAGQRQAKAGSQGLSSQTSLPVGHRACTCSQAGLLESTSPTLRPLSGSSPPALVLLVTFMKPRCAAYPLLLCDVRAVHVGNPKTRNS